MRIAIDAGHGKYTPGKNCLETIDPGKTREWFLNNRIASKLEKLLNQYKNVETVRLDDPTGETDVPLFARTNKANKWGANWVISVHHNAGILGGSGGGMVVFTYITSNAAEKAMQKAIYDECVANGGLIGRSTPLASQNFHMVREPKGNAILIEYGFMDSAKDTPIILREDFSTRMAEATAKAIAKQLHLIKKEEQSDMITIPKEKYEALIAKVEDHEKELKIYHYWTSLPEYALKPIKALYEAGLFAGDSPDDLGLNATKMECLVIMAKALERAGIIKY